MAKVFLPIPVGYEHMKPHDIQCRIITIIWHMSDHIQGKNPASVYGRSASLARSTAAGAMSTPVYLTPRRERMTPQAPSPQANSITISHAAVMTLPISAQTIHSARNPLFHAPNGQSRLHKQSCIFLHMPDNIFPVPFRSPDTRRELSSGIRPYAHH